MASSIPRLKVRNKESYGKRNLKSNATCRFLSSSSPLFLSFLLLHKKTDPNRYCCVGAESAKYLTYNVESSKAYNKHEPKRITMDAAEKLFLEHKSQLKLLSDKSPKQKAESSDVSNGKNSQTKKKTRKILCENLNDID